MHFILVMKTHSMIILKQIQLSETSFRHTLERNTWSSASGGVILMTFFSAALHKEGEKQDFSNWYNYFLSLCNRQTIWIFFVTAHRSSVITQQYANTVILEGWDSLPPIGHNIHYMSKGSMRELSKNMNVFTKHQKIFSAETTQWCQILSKGTEYLCELKGGWDSRRQTLVICVQPARQEHTPRTATKR